MVTLEWECCAVKWNGLRVDSSPLSHSLTYLSSFFLLSSLPWHWSPRGVPLSQFCLCYSLYSVLSFHTLSLSLSFTLISPVYLAPASPTKASKMDHYCSPSNLGVFLVLLSTSCSSVCMCLSSPAVQVGSHTLLTDFVWCLSNQKEEKNKNKQPSCGGYGPGRCEAGHWSCIGTVLWTGLSLEHPSVHGCDPMVCLQCVCKMEDSISSSTSSLQISVLRHILLFLSMLLYFVVCPDYSNTVHYGVM